MSNQILISPPAAVRMVALTNAYDSQGANSRDALAILDGLRSGIESAIFYAKVKLQDELRQHRSEGASEADMTALYDALNDAFIGTAMDAVRRAVRGEPRLFNEVI